MTSYIASNLGYKPADQPSSSDTVKLTKQPTQAQPMMQAGGPAFSSSAPAPPPPPQLQLRPTRPSFRLRTRNWNSSPWKSQAQQGDAYRPPASFLNASASPSHIPVYANRTAPKTWGKSISSSTPQTNSLLGVYDPASQTSHSSQPSSHLPVSSTLPGATPYSPSANAQPTSYSLPQGGVANYGSSGSGLPTTHYTPSSTIPLSHNFHLPSSQLAHSTTAPSLSKNVSGANPYDIKPGESQYPSYPASSAIGGPSLSKNLSSGANPYDIKPGESQFASYPGGNKFNIPTPPPLPTWNRTRLGVPRTRATRPMRPLRTRNWGLRGSRGWSGFNPREILAEQFLLNRARHAPQAPPFPSMFRQRKWVHGPYRMRPLRTRHWGLRNENGWSGFNRAMYNNEAALPFNANRSRAINWADESGTDNLNRGISSSNFNNLPATRTSYIAPTTVPVVAPLPTGVVSTPASGIPLKGRKARRAARKQAKLSAIQQKLTTQLNPPIGDPAVNHYRRGAPAVVPTVGTTVAGQPAIGGRKGRRQGRKNTLGTRRHRTSAALPVPATQPPFVTPVPTNTIYQTMPSSLSTPVAPAYPSQQPLRSGTGLGSSAGIPLTSGAALGSSGGIPFTSGTALGGSTGAIQQQHLYSSTTQQQRPLSSTLSQSSGLAAQQPLYSANEPVAANILEKKFDRPTYVRPTGSATF